MQRYPGFLLTGKVESRTSINDNFERSSYNEDKTAFDPYQAITSVRLTAEGFEYRSTSGWRRSLRDRKDVPDVVKTTLPHVPHLATGKLDAIRELIVIGEDSRVLVDDTTVFPYSAVVEIDLTRREGGCTGVLIAPNAVLTAAHCLYSSKAQTWKDVASITPGRYRDRSTTVAPFGTWKMSEMLVLDEFINGNEKNYDVGVIIVQPRYESDDNGNCLTVLPGDVAGSMGLRPAESTNLTDIHITGYPAETPNGQMWSSGVCSTQDEWIVRQSFAYHSCDTSAGMSGSAFLTSTNVAVGVHGYGFPGAKKNGGALLTGSLYDKVYSWLASSSVLRECSAADVTPDEQDGTQPECAVYFLTLSAFCK